MRLILEASTAPDWTWFTQGGAVGILAAVLICLVKGWLVPGKQYEEVCAQRDKALEQVYKLAEAQARALEAVERKITS